jgi:hypothetical protein
MTTTFGLNGGVLEDGRRSATHPMPAATMASVTTMAAIGHDAQRER